MYDGVINYLKSIKKNKYDYLKSCNGFVYEYDGEKWNNIKLH